MDASGTAMPRERVARLLRRILTAEGEPMGCDDCFEALDRCADLIESGRPYDEVYPEVQKHLDECLCCDEDFQALLTALDGAQAGPEPASA